MNLIQEQLELSSQPRGLHAITREVAELVARSGVNTGLCHVFVHHTSASLIIQENADPDVQRDLNAFMDRLVPDGDPLFRHTAEGPDDMPAHVRSVLTATSLNIPVSGGRLALGIWQGLYLWEHRTRASGRRITVTIQGR